MKLMVLQNAPLLQQKSTEDISQKLGDLTGVSGVTLLNVVTCSASEITN